jgi:hypothetical protein
MTLDLFNKVAEANARIDGWCSPEKAFTLASIVVAFRPAVIVEIGLWKGKSFSAMALACKAVNHGICIGVDPWSREVAVREQTQDADRAWWAGIDFDAVHREFMANMVALDVEKFIRIERKESRDFQPPDAIGLASVDGAHSDTAMHDMVKIAPRVVFGGYIVTDDTDWHGGGVARGERRLLEMGFVKINKLSTGAIFQRIR